MEDTICYKNKKASEPWHTDCLKNPEWTFILMRSLFDVSICTKEAQWSEVDLSFLLENLAVNTNLRSDLQG